MAQHPTEWSPSVAAYLSPLCFWPLEDPQVNTHKGCAGRIGVLGGSAQYTGAPYYAGMSALRTGADLVTVFCADEAATAIKSYSPELMVLPVYRACQFDDAACHQQQKIPDEDGEGDSLRAAMVEKVIDWLPRLHGLVVGPGLGRCPLVQSAVADILRVAIQHRLWLILDADALDLLRNPLHRGILEGYSRVVLTPNAVEYKRLFPDEDGEPIDQNDPLASATFVRKGKIDTVYRGLPTPCNQELSSATVALECHEQGGFKRSGGIGDILAGTVATFVVWQDRMHAQDSPPPDDDTPSRAQWACWTACCAVKRATRKAYTSKRRSMTAPDILEELGPTIREMEELVPDTKL